jgi:uncharacterized sodium:solute symporter family permease YidK
MEGRATRVLVAVAAVLVVVADALYLGIVFNQGPHPPESFTIPFIAAYLLLLAVALVVSLMSRWGVSVRAALRAAAAAGLLVLGVLALMSIGLALVIAGAMAFAATVRTVRRPLVTASNLMGAASAVIAVGVLIAGFEVTERMIVCPDQGSMSGGGSGFLTGAYYYDCVNGHLNFHSGSCNSGAIDENGNVTHPGC